MMALESFAAFTNELSEIPGRMLEGWRDLTRLCLWTNKLTAMPPEIGHMRNLQVHWPVEFFPTEDKGNC